MSIAGSEILLESGILLAQLEKAERKFVSTALDELERKTRSRRCKFISSDECINKVTDIFVSCGKLSEQMSKQQFKAAIEESASSVSTAFHTRRFMNKATKDKNIEEAARILLSAADMIDTGEPRVDKAKTIACALYMHGCNKK